MLTLPTAVAAAALAAAPPVSIDGSFEEWTTVPRAVDDPADAPAAELDLGAVHATSDESTLSLLIELRRPVNPQRLDGQLLILLDTDGVARTGSEQHGLAGVDAVITFTAPGSRGRDGMGVGLTVFGKNGAPAPEGASPYDVGFHFAPTYASERIEVRFDRGADLPGSAPFMRGKQVTAKLVLLDGAGAVADKTDAFTIETTPTGSRIPPLVYAGTADPLVRAGDLRIMSWNTEFGAILRHRTEAARILAAVNPDVVLFQELTDEVSAEELRSIFEQAAPRRSTDERSWTVLIGRPGGDLRSGLVSRLPMTPSTTAEPIVMDPNSGRVVRTAGGIVEHDGKRLLVVSAHLKCCGRIGDRADSTRVRETEAMRAAIRRAVEQENLDGVIVGGDLNLVGSRRPLDILASDTDVDGSSLAVANPMQLDGRTNATWGDTRQAFVWGRLDFILHSDESLRVDRGLVLDTMDLGTNWLNVHGLAANDTATVTDHLPLIIDLSWR